MRLWVTRAEPDASRQAENIAEMGHQAVVDPLLTIQFDKTVPLALQGVQALIATSQNGLRALSERSELEDAIKLPIFVVGPGSAALARDLGFSAVYEGRGTADGLVDVIAEGCDRSRGTLLHLAGAALASDLKGSMEALGFKMDQPALYEAVRASDLSAERSRDLAENRLDGVILMSPRTAKVYMKVISAGGRVEAARKLHYYCMSKPVADCLAPLDSRQLSVAARPREADLLDLLDGRRAD